MRTQMLWLRCVVLVVCFSTLGTAVSLQQCGGQGLVTVSPHRPYNVTCPHDDTTFNVTWLFTSLMDPPTNYVITRDCLLFSRSSEAYCRSRVPGFRVVRPRYAYTSLEVDWGHLSGAMTFGRVTCLLDGVTSGTCFLRLLVEETTSPPPSPSTLRSTTPLTSVQPELPLTSSSPPSSSPVFSASPSSSPTTTTAASERPPTTSPPTSELTNSQRTGMVSGGLPSTATTTSATTTSATATSVPRDVSSSFTSPTMLSTTFKSSRPDAGTESSSSTHHPTTTTTTTTTTPSGDVRSPSTPPTTTTDARESSHTERVVVIAVVVAIVAGIPAIAVGIIVCCLWRKRRRRFRSRSVDEGRLQFANTLDDTRRDIDSYPPSTKK